MTQNEWIKSLKIALVNEEIEQLAILYADIPSEFDSLESAKEASMLMAAVIGMLKTKREELQLEMDQTKKAIVYQQNQGGNQKTRLNGVC